jgi:tetratricopeptide (TPR) repeat protein
VSALFKRARGEASGFFNRRYSFQFVGVLLRIFLDIGKGRFADSTCHILRREYESEGHGVAGQSQHNPDELFELAQSAEEGGDIAEAERLYRVLMKSDPTDASAPFNLGNLLRASARNIEAEAALRAATRADPTFADAWYNLGDLMDEQGRVEAAIECLRTALRAAPDHADAMFNLALLLQRTNQYTEAAVHWRHYLATDHQSEWAPRARRSLKFCEMQINLIASA